MRNKHFSVWGWGWVVCFRPCLPSSGRCDQLGCSSVPFDVACTKLQRVRLLQESRRELPACAPTKLHPIVEFPGIPCFDFSCSTKNLYLHFRNSREAEADHITSHVTYTAHMFLKSRLEDILYFYSRTHCVGDGTFPRFTTIHYH